MEEDERKRLMDENVDKLISLVILAVVKFIILT